MRWSIFKRKGSLKGFRLAGQREAEHKIVWIKNEYQYMQHSIYYKNTVFYLLLLLWYNLKIKYMYHNSFNLTKNSCNEFSDFWFMNIFYLLFFFLWVFELRAFNLLGTWAMPPALFALGYFHIWSQVLCLAGLEPQSFCFPPSK
jgi:hypothetical protein